jgi:hypothetical protein
LSRRCADFVPVGLSCPSQRSCRIRVDRCAHCFATFLQLFPTPSRPQTRLLPCRVLFSSPQFQSIVVLSFVFRVRERVRLRPRHDNYSDNVEVSLRRSPISVCALSYVARRALIGNRPELLEGQFVPCAAGGGDHFQRYARRKWSLIDSSQMRAARGSMTGGGCRPSCLSLQQFYSRR